MLDLKLHDAAAAAENLSVALRQCLELAGNAAWTTMPNRRAGSVPYACGMVTQFALVANVQKRHNAIGAFAFWKACWKANPRYDENSLRAYFAAMVDADTAEKFDQLLVASNIPLSTTLTALLQAADLKLSPGKPAKLAATLALLMRFDCNGSSGFWTHSDHYLTEKIASCKSFRGGEKIYAFEGHDLFAAALDAARAAKRACLASRAVTFKIRDGQDLTIPCAASVGAAISLDPPLTEFDPAQVASILLPCQ